MIGRQVYGLLDAAGFVAVAVSPRMVYVTPACPTWSTRLHAPHVHAMIEGVGPNAISAGLIDAESFEASIRALHRTTEPDGMFSYTSFKARLNAAQDSAAAAAWSQAEDLDAGHDHATPRRPGWGSLTGIEMRSPPRRPPVVG